MVGERETGNETYAANLLAALADLEDDTEFIVATAHPEVLAARLPPCPRFRPVPVSSSPARRLLIELPRLARRHGADMLHVTYAGPPLARIPIVVTIHDVAYRRNPSWFSPRDRAVLALGIGLTAPRAAQIIAISEHAKAEICDTLAVPPAKVSVTLLAAAPGFRRLNNAALTRFDRTRWGVQGPYVLAVGNLQPRKNIRRLVEAFARLPPGRFPHQLVVAGQAKWRESDVQASVRGAGLESRVVFTGYVPYDDLVGLMNCADVFVYPSLYEGFGLPVIEAMACGAPVITSNTTSLPEVAGDAALFIDPLDTTDLASALARILGDPDVRARMAKASLERAADFSWRKTADGTLKVYRAALAKQRGRAAG
jgi:glycosyltransferase involved in cell wall biosynthesis